MYAILGLARPVFGVEVLGFEPRLEACKATVLTRLTLYPLLRPRQELNPHFQGRNLTLYPLSYEGLLFVPLERFELPHF